MGVPPFWFLARVAVPAFPAEKAHSGVLRGFGIIFTGGFIAALVGFLLRLRLGPESDLSNWQGFTTSCVVVDLANFVRVAYIHNASYLGGLVGLIVVLLHLSRQKRKVAGASGSCQLS